MSHVVHGLTGEERQRLRGDFEELVSLERGGGNIISGELAVYGIVMTVLENLLIAKLRHASIPPGQGCVLVAKRDHGCCCPDLTYSLCVCHLLSRRVHRRWKSI